MNEEIIDPNRRSLFNGAELWKYRELFYFFTWRDVKIKYKQTLLGFAWAVLQPLLMMTIFTVFARTLKIQTSVIPYQVFVFTGLLMWNIFSTGVVAASNSIINNSIIIRKIYFPRLVIPVSSVLVSLFDFMMAAILLLPLLIYYHVQVDVSAIWLWPFAILVAVVATMGPGCLLAALNIKYRDFRYVIPFVVQVLFFLSPVIYPVAMIDNKIIQHLLVCSPIYAAIELFRVPLTGVWPNQEFLMISLSSGVVFLAIGLLYFRRTEDFFADLV